MSSVAGVDDELNTACGLMATEMIVGEDQQQAEKLLRRCFDQLEKQAS